MCIVQDVVNEAVKWGGKVLLHQEVALPAAGRSTGGGAIGSTAGQPQPGGTAERAASLASARSGSISSLPAPLVAGSFLTPPAGPLAPAAVKLAGVMASPAAASLAAAGRPQLSPLAPPASGVLEAMRVSSSQILVGAAAAAEAAGSITDNAAGEVITAPVDVRPGAAVVPFWEAVDLDALGLRRSGSGSGGGGTPGSNNVTGGPSRPSSSSGGGSGSASGNNSSGNLPLATCLEVAKALQATGLHITYRRIPLSRERTPVPSDLSDMLKQVIFHQRIGFSF